MNKELKLIAVSPKYKKHALTLMAPVYGSTFITGQEYLPGDEKTIGGLTANQMLGLEPLSEDQKKKFPYVLRPDIHYHFTNNMTFNMANPEHVAKYNFLMRVCRDIAPSKAEFTRGRHTHYIYDKVNEAKFEVKRVDLEHDAIDKVKKASFETVADVVSYLSYVDVEFRVDINASTKDEIYAAAYKACAKTPQKVIDCFTKDIREEILVVKMIQKAVIKKTKDGFEDNGTYLGKTINDVIEFSRKKENAGRLSRWESLSTSIQKPVIVNDPTSDKFLASMEDEIAQGNIKEAMALNSVIEREQLSEGQKERFVSLKLKLVELQEEKSKENEDKLAEAQKVAREEYSAMELDKLYKLCGEKKIKGELWKEKSKEEVIELLVSKVKIS